MVFLLIRESSLFHEDINHSSTITVYYPHPSSQSLTCISVGFIMAFGVWKFTFYAVKL